MQRPAARKSTIEARQIFITGLAILASLAPAAAISAAPTDPSRVAMVFPPWWSAARAFEAAASEGEILGEGGVPFVVIVHLDPSKAARGTRKVRALFMLGADSRSLCSSAPLDAKS